MPISPRLSGGLYRRILNLVRSANDFLFFGTYSIGRDYSIIDQITMQKQNNAALLLACLIPPPTDFILWDFSVRGHLLRAYGLTGANQVDLARAVAQNPQPAYSILENLWNQSRAHGSQRAVISHIRKIGELCSRNAIVFLEPNMHAKFIVSESNIYEGSGNLTRYGLTVNVEVFNFYPRRYEKVYQYALSSYADFLADYLANFVDWKLGSRYLTCANQLGNRVEQVANSFRIRFNPTVNPEKVNILRDSRDKLIAIRSELWQLKGHKLLLNLDFSLSLVQRQIQSVLSRLWEQKEKEIEPDTLDSIYKDLGTIKNAANHVGSELKELKADKENLSWYEAEYLEKNLAEAKRFREYLAKLREKEPK